jgi:hypothetical protein
MSVRAKRGGDHVGANPADRGKPGSKIQLVCEGRGLPLAAAVTAANVPDVTMLQAKVDDIPPVRTPLGRRRHRPGKLDADKGYDSASNCAWLRRRRIAVRIARTPAAPPIESTGDAAAFRTSNECRPSRPTVRR